MPDFLSDVLSRENNYGIAQAVGAALELKLAPTLFIYNDKQPDDPWDQTDKKLAVAMHILNKQTCPKCGQPLWICRSDDRNLTFKVKTGTCYATKALEDKQAANEKAKRKLKNGEFQYVVPEMLFENTFPTRADWLESMSDD